MLRQGHFYVPAQPVLVNSSQSVHTSEKGTPTMTDSDLADFVTRTTYDDVSDTARIQLKCPRSAHSGEVVRVPLATDTAVSFESRGVRIQDLARKPSLRDRSRFAVGSGGAAGR